MKRILQIVILGLVSALASVVCAKTQEYSLTISKQIVNITGKPLKRITINDSIPGPTLTFTDGDEAVIHVHNAMDEDTSIHWHGLLLPGRMDGMPGFNGFPGIKPGETFTYHFPIRQHGTYWYHAHSMMQEQDGHYGSIIIHPKGNDHIKADRDYVIMLSDFHEDDSNTIMANLKKDSEYYMYARRTVGDFFADVKKIGFKKAWANAKMWGKMRMLPTDLSDINDYTFLVNGKTSEQNWTGIFKPGETLRLRFINASAMSFYDVRIPGLQMTVVAADGQQVEPIAADEFRFGVAETYDVLVTPKRDKAYTIVAEPIDRSGFALATLASREGMRGRKPEHRPRSLLTMADMGSGHDMTTTDHRKHSQSTMEHHAHDEHAGHDMTTTDHRKHSQSTMEHHAHDEHAGHDMTTTDHRKHNQSEMEHHAHDEHAEHNMHSTINTSLRDFDTGVSGSGWANAHTPKAHKALTYKDLRYYGTQTDQRMPMREIAVVLDGNMERYIWTLNGKKFNESTPIDLEYGERVRLKFINKTMMAHPMHLHGMFVQLENGQPLAKLPNKHTVIVAPGDSYSALLTANEPGAWAIHCHLLYHMTAGMMNKIVVAKLNAAKIPAKPNPRKMKKPKSHDHNMREHSTMHYNNKDVKTPGTI